MSTVYLADPPESQPPFRPISAEVLRATATEIVWRQTLSDGAGHTAFSDLYYIGAFTYPSPGKLDGVTGTVTEVKGLYNESLVTLRWSGFSTPLEVMDRADMTVGGWDEFYRTVLLPGDDLITSSRAIAERLNGYAGDDTITSGPGDDTLEGGAGRDYLRGGDGADAITGGADFDDINGNVGDDSASGGLGDDWVVGGKDRDLLNGEAGDDIVYGNLGDDTAIGGDGADIIRGGQDNDVLRGDGGDDFLAGDRGDDTVSGGAGADVFFTFGQAGLDRVTDFNRAEGDRVQVEPGTAYSVAQVGADTVITMTGGAQMVLEGVQASALGAGWINGSAEGQALRSAGTESSVVGGYGPDTITASEGGDTLTGGAGADLFVIPTFMMRGAHRITDFTPGEDRLDLRGLAENQHYPGSGSRFDGYVDVRSDGHGGTVVYTGVNIGADLIYLDNVAPAQLSMTNWIIS